MIVVTGMARTGTSMMMQTLLHLGLDVPAPKFIPEHTRIINFNPKGFYEIDFDPPIDTSLYKGKAVKIFPVMLRDIDPKDISKLIVCTREREEIIRSYSPIHKTLDASFTPELTYEANMYALSEYIDKINYVQVWYHRIRSNPGFEIGRVIDYLGIEPDRLLVQNAIKNINPF